MRLDPQREIRTFDQVYADELPYVWSCLRSLGVAPQDLEDAAQDVFVVVHRRLPDFRGEARLRTWLFSIAVRVASRRRRDGSRAKRRHEALVTRGGADAIDPLDPEEAVARRHASARLERFTAALDTDKQRVFQLWAIEGRSPQDIADALALPRNTVYSRLRVVRQSLSELCAHYHARDEARMSTRQRRDRDAAQARIRAVILAGPLTGLPEASTGSWWAGLRGLGVTRALEVGAAIGLATVVAGTIVIGRGRSDATTADRTSDAVVTPHAAGATEAIAAGGAPPEIDVARPGEAPSTPARSPSMPAKTSARSAEPLAPRVPSSRATTPASTSFSPASPSASEPSLDRAVALIHEARDALAAGQLSAAEDALQRHAQELPAGPLEREREAYAAMLACMRGDAEPGRSFVAAHSGTRLGQRVSAACASQKGSTISTAGGHQGLDEDVSPSPSMDPLGALPRRRL